MITRVVLGTGVELQGVQDAQEIVQDNGDHVFRGLSINFGKTEEGYMIKVHELEDLLTAEGALSNIKIFKKDEEFLPGGEATVGEEYLAIETDEYLSIHAIYRSIGQDVISVSLKTIPGKLSDKKYQELLLETKLLQDALDAIVGGETVE